MTRPWGAGRRWGIARSRAWADIVGVKNTRFYVCVWLLHDRCAVVWWLHACLDTPFTRARCLWPTERCHHVRPCSGSRHGLCTSGSGEVCYVLHRACCSLHCDFCWCLGWSCAWMVANRGMLSRTPCSCISQGHWPRATGRFWLLVRSPSPGPGGILEVGHGGTPILEGPFVGNPDSLAIVAWTSNHTSPRESYCLRFWTVVRARSAGRSRHQVGGVRLVPNPGSWCGRSIPLTFGCDCSAREESLRVVVDQQRCVITYARALAAPMDLHLRVVLAAIGFACSPWLGLCVDLGVGWCLACWAEVFAVPERLRSS